ncbi:MAG: flagellar hook-length control protein FliK [Desulfitobacteriaceae bacterium]
MTVNAVLAPVQPGAKKANGVAGDSAAPVGDEGQLFAAVLGQWLYALEGAQGQKFGEENPSIVPAGKEANSGIVTGGQEGTSPLLLARGFAHTGMYEQTSTGTGSELDQYRESIVKLLEELNGEIIIPRQGVKAEFPYQTQEFQSKLLAQAFNLLQVQSPGLAGVSQALEQVSNDLAASGQGEQATVQGIKGVISGTGKNVVESASVREIAAQSRGIAPQSKDIGVDLRQLSDSRQNTGITNTGAFDPNVETGMEPDPAHDASVLGEKSRVSEIINKSTNEDKGSLGELVQSAVTAVRSQSRNLRASGSSPVDAAGGFEQDLKTFGDGQVLAENRPGSGKISRISSSAQADSGEGMTDNRPQSGMSQTNANGQDRVEALPTFGEGRTGTTESNSARGNIGTEALNGSKGPLPVWDKIAEAVREHRNSPEVKELQIQLHPAELGKIKVFLHWQDGQVNLQVQASESATGALLQHSLSDLRQALEQAGVSCGLLQSGLGGGNREQQPEQESSAHALARQGQAEEDRSFLSEHAYGFADMGSRINYMA